MYKEICKIKPELGKQIYLKNKDNSKTETENIDIVFSSDDNYVQHCCAAIVSILLNSDASAYFRFYILDGGISKENKKKLLELKSIRDFSVQFIDMTKFDFSMFPMNRKYISIATYYRLLLLEILPEYVNKVIYLDCDIIVEQDIKILWDYDINDYLAGVVEDEGSISQLKRLELPSKNNYFNAGVVVFNIEKLKKFNFKEKCINYYNNNKDKISLQDQDILNGVLNGLCKYFPLNWNTNSRLFFNNELEHHFTDDEAISAIKKPAILHYTDKVKPWQKNCIHPLKEEYWKYLSYTGFKKQVMLHSIHKFFCFFIHFAQNHNTDILKICGLTVYKLNLGEEKSLHLLGIPIFTRIKNEKGKKVYIGGIKVYDPKNT